MLDETERFNVDLGPASGALTPELLSQLPDDFIGTNFAFRMIRNDFASIGISSNPGIASTPGKRRTHAQRIGGEACWAWRHWPGVDAATGRWTLEQACVVIEIA